jgi:hypothetical protein
LVGGTRVGGDVIIIDRSDQQEIIEETNAAPESVARSAVACHDLRFKGTGCHVKNVDRA